MNTKRFCWQVSPVALNENIVKGNTWRFTFLTNRLIRLEYDPNGVFEDRASQTAIHRDFPKVAISLSCMDGDLLAETDSLSLRYRKDAPFAADTLQIALKNSPATVWHYGDRTETLGGTVSTLDRVDGEIAVGDGVCSRTGVAVIDDSDRMVLDGDGMPDLRHPNTKDLYFFGYGLSYTDAVADYFRLTGVPPLLPDYALGNWWSRYHAYTQDEYIELMDKFANHNLPFSVAVVDMDWHVTQPPEDVEQPLHGTKGWTGYTWNKELFPDYKSFLKALHARGLKTALNLHPACGIRKHEVMYEAMCEALGRPADGTPASLDILNPRYMECYFDIVHHPYEEDGVDFWWMDWQQGKDYWWIHEPNKGGKLQDPREVLDPLWLLNHLHIIDISRTGKRPMFFSRYSGAGSQRYPVGFSGDTFITWQSLDFQPYFTACASNIGYPWWSHDIGGHMLGYRDDELTARWVQLGVFSPINRLHSTNSPFINKEPWDFNTVTCAVMENSLRLRHRLFPYLYTMNYRTHKELLPLVQPMYYSHPHNSAAYEVKNQYWFGNQMIVAPITQKADPAVGLGCVRAWLPKGLWTDFFTGAVYNGLEGRFIDLHRDAFSIPVLCKAGAIIPMHSQIKGGGSLIAAEELDIIVTPGADNTFVLYEDEGDGNRYKDGAYATTKMTLSYSDTKATFTLHPSEGDVSLIPQKRRYNVKLRGFTKPAKLLVNGRAGEYTLDKASHTLNVTVEASVADGFTVSMEGEGLCSTNDDFLDKAVDILKRAQTGMLFKDKVLKAIKTYYDPSAENMNIFLFRLNLCCDSAEHRGIVEAVAEQFLYSKDKY